MAPPRKLKLPASLLQGLDEQPSSSGRGRGSDRGERGNKSLSRREQRKAQRVQKKQARSAPRWRPEAVVTSKGKHARSAGRQAHVHKDDDDEGPESEDDGNPDLEDNFEDVEKGEDTSGSGEEDVKESPGLSTSVRRKLDEDDAEIAALEKRLGLKKGKQSKSFDEDGLGDLLGDLEEEEDDSQGATENRKRKAEADEWLAQKRRKANAAAAYARAAPRASASGSTGDDGNETRDVGSGVSDDDEADDLLSELSDFDSEGEASESDDGGDDGFEGFSEAEETSARHQRENPYVAPVTGVAKYVPPSLRKQQGQSIDEVDAQLCRRVQGLINRLTNDSMVGIIKDFSGLYDDFPRQSVTSALVGLVITLVCAPEKRPDSFFTMMAGFIAGAQKALGMHVSANLIQQLVETFKERHQAASGEQSDAGSKHLIALVAELYNFQVVGSNLLFDYIRIFLNDLSELNTELLLRIIQTCGPSLRREDPQSLKDVISHIKPSSLKNVSVRTSFMIDEMKKLQSNKANATTRNRGKDLAEQRTQIRKRIGTLSGGARDTQPLRMSLKEIESADKNGKWWVVGASWSGNREKDELEAHGNDKDEGDTDSLSDFEINDDLGIPDLRQLAWEQGFNTEVRQNICVALHNCSNAKEAEQNILKLRLNKHQRKEIPEVIVRCAESQLQPKPFYWLVASRFTGEKELAFQFKRCLTSRFRQMGEDIDMGGDELDADDPEEYEDLWLFNMGKFYGTLVAKGYLGLDLLKHRNLAALQRKTQDFVEVFFITILQEAKTGETLQRIFSRLSPEMARGVLYFIKKHVQKTGLLEKKEKKAVVYKASEVEKVLEASLNAVATQE